MTVVCLARDVDASRSSAVVSADGRSLSVSLGLPGESVFSLELDLFDAAVPGAANLSVRAPRTEVRFEKASSAQYMWSTLERPQGAPSPAVTGVVSAPAVIKSSADAAALSGGSASAAAAANTAASNIDPAPAPPKSRGKDWNKLEKELAAEDDAPGEGEEALMKLFRNIYSGADENTRRAMVKSFQTSGGTVLSTNWKEVADVDYEKTKQAPEGMEFVKKD